MFLFIVISSFLKPIHLNLALFSLSLDFYPFQHSLYSYLLSVEIYRGLPPNFLISRMKVEGVLDSVLFAEGLDHAAFCGGTDDAGVDGICFWVQFGELAFDDCEGSLKECFVLGLGQGYDLAAEVVIGFQYIGVYVGVGGFFDEFTGLLKFGNGFFDGWDGWPGDFAPGFEGLDYSGDALFENLGGVVLEGSEVFGHVAVPVGPCVVDIFKSFVLGLKVV